MVISWGKCWCLPKFESICPSKHVFTDPCGILPQVLLSMFHLKNLFLSPVLLNNCMPLVAVTPCNFKSASPTIQRRMPSSQALTTSAHSIRASSLHCLIYSPVEGGAWWVHAICAQLLFPQKMLLFLRALIHFAWYLMSMCVGASGALVLRNL